MKRINILVVLLAMFLASCGTTKATDDAKNNKETQKQVQVQEKEKKPAKKPVLKKLEYNDWRTFKCANNFQFNWRGIDKNFNNIDIRFQGSDIVHRLGVMPAAQEGLLYANNQISMYSQDAKSVVFETIDGKELGNNCTRIK